MKWVVMIWRLGYLLGPWEGRLRMVSERRAREGERRRKLMWWFDTCAGKSVERVPELSLTILSGVFASAFCATLFSVSWRAWKRLRSERVWFNHMRWCLCSASRDLTNAFIRFSYSIIKKSNPSSLPSLSPTPSLPSSRVTNSPWIVLTSFLPLNYRTLCEGWM